MSVISICKATVAGNSGTFRVRTTGTDINFNDCSGTNSGVAYTSTHPCALTASSSATAPYSFPLTIAGAGAACPSLPTLDVNVDSSACASSNSMEDNIAKRHGW